MKKKNILLSIISAYKLLMKERISEREFISILNQRGCVVLIQGNPDHLKKIWKLKILVFGLVCWIIVQLITFWLMVFRGV